MENNKNSDKLNKEEEIDLGQLFKLIGGMFSRLYYGIYNFIKSILMLFLSIVLFIRRNSVKLVIGSVVGLILGSLNFYIKDTKPVYESSMTVSPNFNSTLQLYKSIKYFNALISFDDVKMLSKEFNITPEEAESLKNIEIEPYDNSTQTFISYKTFVKDLDTTLLELVDYKRFSREKDIESFVSHVITVESDNRFIFPKLENTIITSVSNNLYYKNYKEVYNSSLKEQIVAYERSIAALDTLQRSYKEVLISSKGEGAANNIYMEAAYQQETRDVFDKYIEANSDLSEMKSLLAENIEVVNILSGFSPVGSKVGVVTRDSRVFGLVLGFLLVLLVLTLIEINKWLVTFEKE